MREFCVKCQKEVEYKVLKNWRQKIVKGFEVEFEKQEAICNECQHLIFVDTIHEQNSENAKKLIRKKFLMKRSRLSNRLCLSIILEKDLYLCY